MLTPEENEILLFLRPLGKLFANPKEICRRAGGKWKWNENPDWAMPALKRMEAQGLLETNSLGHFRIKRKEEERHLPWDPRSQSKEEKEERQESGSIPLDPCIQQILSKSNMDFSKSCLLKDPQDYRLPSGDRGEEDR